MIKYCGCMMGGPLVPVLGKDGKVARMEVSVVAPYAAALQDAKYGVGMRVHTPNDDGHTCTVCGKKR